MEYKYLFTPMKIGTCEIKNRIVMPPMLMGFSNFDGTPTEQLMAYYEERAKGGTGLIMTEITRVNDFHGSAAFAQLSMSHDRHIKPMYEFARRIQKHGAKFFVQLHHPGRQNVGLAIGTVPLSIVSDKVTNGLYGKALFKIVPKVAHVLADNGIHLSSVAPSACDPAYFAGGRVRALSNKEVKSLEQDFINAAVRCFKAGVDGVELHASHGYLIQQFLSPATNFRTDEYGGSLENRMRFLLNILNGIKEACGKSYPVIVRLTVDECYAMNGQPGKGYTLEEGVEMAKIIEANGADAIDVSSAGYDNFNYWLEPVSFELGWRKYMAKAVKDAVSIPVLAANLIRSPEQAEKQIAEGTQDFASLGRPHIADPHFAEKAMKGETIKRCICCLNCIESMQNNAYKGGHGECAVNPFVGHEGEPLIKDGDGKKVIVIGAGPAGLSCAEICARRGFDVELLEKSDKAGGQILLAAAPPKKGKTAWFIEDAVATCEALGVKIKYNTEANPEEIAKQNPYAVVLACGSSPIKPKFAGEYDYDKLLTFEDILSGRVELKDKKVAVIGSGMTGLETAHTLAENGCTVTIVEMAKEVAPGTWMQHKDDVIPHLDEAGAKFLIGEKLAEVFEDRIITENVDTGVRSEIACDAVVLSLGSRPNAGVVEAFDKADIDVFVIGDNAKVGRIADATAAGREAAISI